jgi:hypothetical protein
MADMAILAGIGLTFVAMRQTKQDLEKGAGGNDGAGPRRGPARQGR